MQGLAAAQALALQRIQRNTRSHSHASGAVLGTLVLPRAKLHTRHQGAVPVTEHSRDGFALWAEIISTDFRGMELHPCHHVSEPREKGEVGSSRL